MAERRRTTAWEELAVQAPTARATFKAAEQTLKQLGIAYDLSSKGNVYFLSEDEIREADRNQAVETNELARIISERELTIPIVSTLDIGTGIVSTTEKGNSIGLSFVIGESFMTVPIDREGKELLSVNSILIFRHLSRLLIHDQLPQTELTRNRKLVANLRLQMIEEIKSAASQDNEKDVLKLAEDMEKRTTDPRSLSVTTKGARVDLMIYGKQLMEFGINVNQALITLIGGTMEEQFIKLMENRNLWFIPPSRFQTDIAKEFITINFKEALVMARENFPFIEIPENFQEIFKRLTNGQFAQEVLNNLVGELDESTDPNEENVATVSKEPTEISTMTIEDFHASEGDVFQDEIAEPLETDTDNLPELSHAAFKALEKFQDESHMSKEPGRRSAKIKGGKSAPKRRNFKTED